MWYPLPSHNHHYHDLSHVWTGIHNLIAVIVAREPWHALGNRANCKYPNVPCRCHSGVLLASFMCFLERTWCICSGDFYFSQSSVSYPVLHLLICACVRDDEAMGGRYDRTNDRVEKMISLLLSYLFVYFVRANKKKNGPHGDIISFNNLEEEKILRYHSSGSLNECYLWYYLREDFFDIHYLKIDDKVKKRKKLEKKKKKKIPKSNLADRKNGNNSKWITTDNICTGEILILLNKKKATCTPLTSFIIRESEDTKRGKKYISVQYHVNNTIFMINDYIITYVNTIERKNVYIIAKGNHKLIITEGSYFTLYYDEKYIEHAHIKYVRGELELTFETKEKSSITKIALQLHNKCKPIFFFILVYIYELLTLLPNGVHFEEDSLVRLVLRREEINPLRKEGHNVHSCTVYKKKLILKRPFEGKIIQHHFLKNCKKANIVRRNIENSKLVKCLQRNYITSFQNVYQIVPSENYEIVTEQMIKVKNGAGTTNTLVVKNVHSHQKFSAILHINKGKEVKVNCFYPIFSDLFEKIPAFFAKGDEKWRRRKEDVFYNEIDQLKNHFFYKTQFHFDNLYLQNYFKLNAVVDGGEHFLTGRRYLCRLQLYAENGIPLHHSNYSDSVRWIFPSKRHNFSLYALHNFEDEWATYFVAINKGKHSFQVWYKNYPKVRKQVTISPPLQCYIKDNHIMSSLFVLINEEKIYYRCRGGNTGKHTLRVFNTANLAHILADEKAITITKTGKEPSSGSINGKNSISRIDNNGCDPPSMATVLFCDERDHFNCFLSRLYMVRRISEYVLVAEKSAVEINEIVNVYVFMYCDSTQACYMKESPFLRRRKDNRFRRNSSKVGHRKGGKSDMKSEPSCVADTPIDNYPFGNRSMVPISSCFYTVHRDLLIRYDREAVEVMHKQRKFQTQHRYRKWFKSQFDEACAFFQIKGKRARSRTRISTVYRKDKPLKSDVVFQVYKKVKGLFCQDFVCSKFVKFGQISNLLLYDGFENLPYEINITLESNEKEIIIRENTLLSGNYNKYYPPFLFKNMFFIRNFSNSLFLSEKKKETYKSIFTNETFFENHNNIFVKKLYNRRLFEYDFVFNYARLDRRGRRESNPIIPRHNRHVKNRLSYPSLSIYDPFFLVRNHFIIYCNASDKNHVTSNIIAQMTYVKKQTRVMTQNYFPIHFKYPSSIQIALFDKYVDKLHIVRDSKLFLYKNNEYYLKAFLIDAQENIILTNESFTYAIESDIKDFQQLCLKDKSHYLDGERRKWKNVVQSSNKVLLRCGTKLDSFAASGAVWPGDTFHLTVTYSFKNAHVSSHFEKHMFLQFYDEMWVNYDNLVLLFSPNVYYKLHVCASVKEITHPWNLRYVLRGSRQITVLSSLEWEIASARRKVPHVVVDTARSGSPALKKVTTTAITIASSDVSDASSAGKTPPSKARPFEECTAVYVGSKREAIGTFSVLNELIYETRKLDVHLSFEMISRIKISLPYAQSETDKPVPLRIEFLNRDNKKFHFIPVQKLKIRLSYNYNNDINLKGMNFPIVQSDNIMDEMRRVFSLSDEPISDLFYYICSSVSGKYYIQIEVTYSLYNRYISVVSNMTYLIFYQRGILYNDRKILLHPHNQTMELVVQFDHPLISKVLCISKNNYIVKIQDISKLDHGRRNTYVCKIKTGEVTGISEIDIYPIFESYYEVFCQYTWKDLFLERFDQSFYEIEHCYENYVAWKTARGYYSDYHLAEEKQIRDLFFMRIDVTVDYIHGMQLFADNTIYIRENHEVSTFVKFYSSNVQFAYAFTDFSEIKKSTEISYKLEHFISNKNITLDDKMEHTIWWEKKTNRNFPPLMEKNDITKKIVTKLTSSADAFISIRAHKKGDAYLLYSNLVHDNGSFIISQVHNIVVVKNGKNRGKHYIVHLSTNSVYIFHVKFYFQRIRIAFSPFPLSRMQSLRTGRNELSYFAHYAGGNDDSNYGREGVVQKFMVSISHVVGAKIGNYHSKYIPLNVIQYFRVDLYDKQFEHVLFPHNGKLYFHISHGTVLSIKVVSKNHLFIIPHKEGCSYVHLYVRMYGTKHDNKKGFHGKSYGDHYVDVWDEAGMERVVDVGTLRLCVTRPVQGKYFHEKKRFHYVSRVYKLKSAYNDEFYLQPYVCASSVMKQNAPHGTTRLNASNFYDSYKYFEHMSYVSNMEDLAFPHAKHFSIINDRCTRMKL
ncbi:conserved Plasmodium protein, unknown function [Plasmodium ovale curtisi]|uniref:Uncharacterized protein n=2 Tax=Plasmodium ovale TaxID=36330 RepID=A0A1A8VML9_PLAOA|nr:conserved Plasmodium protein, unknown function [Plasmodium ovale curtisi]